MNKEQKIRKEDSALVRCRVIDVESSAKSPDFHTEIEYGKHELSF